MEYVVLGLLMIQELTLYDLNRAFKQGISLFYSASYGSLQVAIKGLLAKGWIGMTEQVERGRNKKLYSITGEGKLAFFNWMFAETPASKLEVTALSKVYFLGLVEDRQQRRQIVGEILARIRQVRAELDQTNAAIHAIPLPEGYRAIFQFQAATLDYGIMAHASAEGWFAALLDSL